MKKRILLSLVSFFAMTAMWAGLTDNFYVIASGAAGKTGQTAELTLNLLNKNAISSWSCTVVLPAGVEFVEGSAVADASRYPTAPALTATKNADGSVSFACGGEVEGSGAAPLAVATFQVTIAADVTPADYPVVTKDFLFVLVSGETRNVQDEKEYTWTIEAGGPNLDINEDGDVNLADAQALLIKVADGVTDLKYDANGDGEVNLADAQYILIWVADHQ